MNVALITARSQHIGFKDNSLLPMLGRPLLAYPFLAARHAERVDHIFLSTDGAETKSVGQGLGMEIIDRPAELSLSHVGHLEVIQNALISISKQCGKVDVLVVMLGNVATHEQGIVDKCVAVLEDNPHVDSCVTVSERNEFHPLRAKSASTDVYHGLGKARFIEILPYLDIRGKVSTNRQDLESVYFLNHSVWALRPSNCLCPRSGQWPGTFMADTVVGIETDHGIDIRSIEDVAFSERWLVNNGWRMNHSPYWEDD